MPLSADDRLAIHELVALHGHLMDDGAFDRLSELFTDDFAYDVTAYGFGVLRGYAAFAEAARTLGDGNPLGHHVTNVVVSEDADGTVRVRSKGLGVPVDGPVGTVVYEDVVRRVETRPPAGTAGARRPATGWRISYRRVVPRRRPLHPEGRSQHPEE
ncbi:nuclear transport factor 2 family protein [Micromonospora antibiotica]|uniref:Nuclear transport factor 2 family protein n=1 Tax=Micromonospora antibiotica TaxID=2807623 RepID=A0ABS3V172_9ACTN|nr:nuclear transport factor 2 family protein [Micromonospora antibiotica]MBO4159366.1 nuclear transport factor 2 family protein [Micromonospora antibiotica]